MKKAFFLALFLSLLIGLSVTASYAATTIPKCLPGCPGCDTSAPGPGGSPSVWEIQKEHADAMRVRTRAYERQITKRNDSTLGVTCFDQGMKLTSRLGLIFSDATSLFPPPPNTTAFGAALPYPDMGATLLLANSLNDVITPVLSNTLLNAGTGALLGILTADALGVLSGLLTPILNAFNSAFTPIITLINQVNTVIAQINQLINLLSGTSPLSIQAAVAVINGIKSFLNTLVSQIMTALNTVIGVLMTAIRNLLLGAPAEMDCNRLQELWDDGSPSGGPVVSIEGSGIEAGTPYMNLKDFLGGTGPTMGQDFTDELGNATDSIMMQNALDNLTGPLSGPGNMPSWPAPPTLPPNATTEDIINAM